VTYCDNPYDTLAGADALLLLTEWRLFRKPDFERVKKLLKTPVIFDGRNQYDPVEMKHKGFVYICVGRG
jgi:UDPglucose 6-dehydrogenase